MFCLKFLFIFVSLFSFLGCKASNVINNVKQDFALEKNVTVFDKSDLRKQFQVPLNGMIIVKEKDTIYTIANRYKVIPTDIIQDNNLIEPYDLKANQILFLRNKNVYVIKQGDNLEKISLRFAVNKDDIVNLNKLREPYELIVGNKILIPKNKDYSVVDLIIDKNIYNEDPKITTTPKNYKTSLNKVKNSPEFIWPAKGDIIKNFGKFGKGQYYDGIDIKTSANTPIYSVLEGTVAFTGSEIKKFGNLILIKHKNGWLSAYSNVSKFNVSQGAVIKKGDIIAFSSDQEGFFHFQLRHNRNPVNPIIYLN